MRFHLEKRETQSNKWITLGLQTQVWFHKSILPTWPWLSLSAYLTPYQHSILKKWWKLTEQLQLDKASQESGYWNQMTNLHILLTPVQQATPQQWINVLQLARQQESTTVTYKSKHQVWHQWVTISWRSKTNHPQVTFLTIHTRMIKTDKMSVISKRSFIEQVKPKVKSS